METWQIFLILFGILFVVIIVIILLSNFLDKEGLIFKKIKNEDMDKYYDYKELRKNQIRMYKKNKK